MIALVKHILLSQNLHDSGFWFQMKTQWTVHQYQASVYFHPPLTVPELKGSHMTILSEHILQWAMSLGSNPQQVLQACNVTAWEVLCMRLTSVF